MNYRKIGINKISAFLAMLSVICFTANAEDICSHGGKSKMLAANVTEAQIATICPAIAGIQQDSPDQIKESRLARLPIGLDVQEIGTRGGMTYVDITVKNNSGKFIKSLYIEVLAYNDESRVGMTNHNFNSVNIGESMIIRNPINTSGRPWNRWNFTYKIH